MGLSSSAAQLQANPASMPPGLVEITGVLPFSETIFLWQSIVLTAILITVSLAVAWFTAPTGDAARTAREFIDVSGEQAPALPPRTRPGEWLEYSPLLTVLLSLLAFGWLFGEFASKPAVTAIANLDTYNLLFLSLGLLLHWRPRSFLDAVARAVPATTGVLIQFPLYGGIALILTHAAGPGGAPPAHRQSEDVVQVSATETFAGVMGASSAVPATTGVLIQVPLYGGIALILTHAAGRGGETLAHRLSEVFVQVASTETFAVVMGAYSAVLGFFVPSGGGKWIVEAPYVMQAANDLQFHLGWAVQVYNAAEALPNLINPFWMLPLLGVLGLRARDIVGFTFLQLLVHIPLVLGLLWVLGLTLTYVPPVMP